MKNIAQRVAVKMAFPPPSPDSGPTPRYLGAHVEFPWLRAAAKSHGLRVYFFYREATIVCNHY